jgi:pyruvate dehydrogenase E1 component alpha subunit
MHLADVDLNFWGGHAIVGAHLPLAAGMALADKYRGKDAVTICIFGDGATNIGYFHEAFNLSMVWKLPVLWVCENNKYGMGTSVERASAVSEIRHKADGFKMPNERVDGMNVVEVYEATMKAIEHVRTEGPLLLEAITYRYRGHSMGDPERYRKSEEIDQWREDDPIGIFRKFILEGDLLDEEALAELENRVEEEVEEAVRFAESSPDPAAETLFDYVYVDTGE